MVEPSGNESSTQTFESSEVGIYPSEPKSISLDILLTKTFSFLEL